MQLNRIDSRYQMNKYHKAIEDLKIKGETTFKAFGNSMLPIIKSGSTLTFRPAVEYQIGDIVFCKVRGRFIDAARVLRKETYYETFRYEVGTSTIKYGWTRQIYGKIIK